MPKISSTAHGSHLGLPESRHPVARGEEHDAPTDRGSPRTFASASSGSGVTYHFPTIPERTELQTWNTEGMGNSEIRSMSSTSNSPRSVRFGLSSEERGMSPLPPGAAPPMMTNEPERVGGHE